jgi:hypothetical protein
MVTSVQMTSSREVTSRRLRSIRPTRAEGAIDLTEALDRLVDGRGVANTRGKVKKWPDERAKIPAAGRPSR